jgi:hypothetical protein
MATTVSNAEDEAGQVWQWKGEPRGAISLAEGLSVAESARRAGVSARTIRRRLAQPAYIAEVARLRTQVLDGALGQLIAASARAVETLVSLLGAASEATRLGAAKGLLQMALELRELGEVEGRVQSLEQVLLRRTEEIRLTRLGGP